MTMSARTAVLTTAAIVSVLAASVACGRKDRQTPESLRADIAALETEREALRVRLNELMVKDPRLAEMPETPVRVGVPTTLARDLIQRVVSGFVDQVTLDLKNIKVGKRGTLKKIITIGAYDLKVTINQVTGKLKTGTPTMTFGGDHVAIAIPVMVVSGGGRATINFKWDGKNVGGAVCGDMDVTQVVSGSVRPATYPVAGGLVFTATTEQIMAAPRLPTTRINLKVVPSTASLATAQKILDDKGGVCGFVVDRVDIMGLIDTLLAKGFNVRLPTEKIKAVAMPVGVEPTMEVRGQPVALGIQVADLSITEQMIWLGARVSVAVGDAATTSTQLR